MRLFSPPVLAAIAIAVMLAGYLAVKLSEAWKRGRELLRLHETWGQLFRHVRDDRPVSALTPDTAPLGSYRIDDPTWADLDLGRVLLRIDRTLTSIGAQSLHRMLRCPLVDPAAIARRQQLVAEVAKDPAERVRLQRALVLLGDVHGWEAASALAGSLPRLPGPVWLLRLLPPAVVVLIGLGASFDLSAFVLTGIGLAFALPLVHTLANRTIGHHLEAVADVRRMLDAAVALDAAIGTTLRASTDDVLRRAKALRRAFGRRIATAQPGALGETMGVVNEYAKAFGLTELVRYQRSWAAIARHREAYVRILDAVGELDAALSIAHLRVHDDQLHAAVIDPDASGLSATGVRHPLVDDAVGNDIDLGPRGLLVTGSNMAGKSTLLRAIGVDAVLAQAIGLACAETWRAPPLRVATAMGARDDLAAGTSLYRAEVDRIHALVDRAGGAGLFLLDEAFRGTNPHERIAASAAVLRSLAARDLVAAATHDRELCELLADVFALGYFTEEVGDDDVTFDYRLRPGVLETTNAIALLERTGFPAALVADARRIAAASRGLSGHTKTGQW